MKKEDIGHPSPIQEIIKKKLNIIYLDNYSQIWDWQLGGYRTETLNPLPSMLYTLKCIWKDNYSWMGGTWIKDSKSNTQNITKDTKLNFLSKCYASWDEVFRDIFSKYGISWRYSNGSGSHGYTTFKWWHLTYYRDHNEWYEDRYQHRWKDKKFLFSKKWKDYDHEYEIGDTYGVVVNKVSEEAFETSLEKKELPYE